MSETLLSHSAVILFGRVVEDIIIKRAIYSIIPVSVDIVIKKSRQAKGVIDGWDDSFNDKKVLITRGNNSGLYKYIHDADWNSQDVKVGTVYNENIVDGWVAEGEKKPFKFTPIKLDPNGNHTKVPSKKKGSNKQLEDQLIQEDSIFARIYAFSFEGAYYELPTPALFLVHDEGVLVTPNNEPAQHASRAPTEPSVTGLPAADFQFSNEMRYWTYDKADYTIRMDIQSGMFEQVLLDLGLDGDPMAGATVRGATVRGATVRGATVRGATVRGATVRGATVRGATVRGGTGGD